MATRFIGTEAMGVFVGTLVEDMIDTVAREHKLYCNVHIPQFFEKDSEYPLTYVPFWAMSLPLKKGDQVMVEFHQGNLMYPVLYKNPDEIDEQFYKKFNLPQGITGGNITVPSALDTVGAFRLGVDSYIIKTDNYTVFHQNNGLILIDKDNNIYIQGNNLNLISSGDLKMDTNGKTSMYTPTGKFKIGSNILSLGKALSDMASAINTLLTGIGTIIIDPATFSDAAWYTTWSTTIAASDIANMTALSTTLPNVFE